MNNEFITRKATSDDRDWIIEVVRGWEADYVITRGRKVYPQDLPAFVAETPDGERIGLVTYEIIGDQCEVVTLDAFRKFSGAGTALMHDVIEVARSQGIRRVWLITTNDNLDAIRFYQRRGFTIAAVHVNAIEHSRKLKPSIPAIGLQSIPLRDEVEFEMWL
ncbi:MAG: GNAT family N-acetyltransferase [Candidatus Zixiibacteriota bacterium]|nr:MAG: GNAT family N-acetyltransferase [candidate division Zixibacteria bacterium]